jgi:hypothetical protein
MTVYLLLFLGQKNEVYYPSFTLFSTTILFANPKINSVASNNNYLFVQLETLPIIDINITFNNGSFNDGELKGLTNLRLILLCLQMLIIKKL